MSFLEDSIRGLSARKKYLDSKYFYDELGDKIFQEIMFCNDYYLTRSELEIFTRQTNELVASMCNGSNDFDVIELGPGDALKSRFLLKCMLDVEYRFRYFPIDISGHILSELVSKLSPALQGLEIHPMEGDFFEGLSNLPGSKGRKKIVLFLGSNIGNMTLAEMEIFCSRLHAVLSPSDLVLTGFDLKKDPDIVLKAYNDEDGLTRLFNLNLLQRMNRELHSDFDLAAFRHYPVYDPESGECRSYLLSLRDQTVRLGGQSFFFPEHDSILMEVSRKFEITEIDQMAVTHGFKTVRNFFDKNNWFTDVLWRRI